MTLLRSARVLALAFGIGCVAVACHHPPAPPPANLPPPPVPPAKKPYVAHFVVSASADVNPDAANRPSPIVVRLYQLKDDAAFKSAEFFALYDTEDKTLNAQEIGASRELVMAPAERKTIDLEISTETRFVGVLAAFRDIRTAQWRAMVPAGPKELTVSIEHARVVLTAAGS